MAEEPAADHLDEHDEEEGGPIKSFLEHLEDLRWVLIKSGVAAGVAMLICLLAGNYVVAILEWPLKRAPASYAANVQVMRVMWGTNQLGVFQVGTNTFGGETLPTNRFLKLEVTPITVGTNQVLGLKAQEDPDAGKPRGLSIDITTLSPAGAFVVATKVAFYAGLVLSSPFIFYFVAQFVFPALKMREKKYVYSG